MVIVKLSKPAVETIIAQCLKDYKSEVFGFLTGHKRKNIFSVENALYSCTGKNTQVNGAWRISRKLEEILKYLPTRIIGDYHSHAMWGERKAIAEPSEGEEIADIEQMQEHPNWIYLILAINDQKRKQKWKYSKNRGLYGSIGSEYYCNLQAFTYNPKTEMDEPTKIICPAALRLR